MHSGFVSLRSALPMNIKARFPSFKVWSKAKSDIDRIAAIWRECLAGSGGPFLFGTFSMADAMYAPVATRLRTYDVTLDLVCDAYCKRVLAHPHMARWMKDAESEIDEIEELEVEF
jgi:glutathione S-transferase